MKFSKDQEIALEQMKSGQNTFLTGKAGTGKSSVLKEFIEWALENDKNIIVSASTGAAAQNLADYNACTVHRAFGLKAKGIVSLPKKANKEITAADIIVIDEISMVRIDLFEHVATTVMLANKEREHDESILARKEGREPDFKPIQLIVVGDFTQLPPVVTSLDKDALKAMFGTKVFAFESKLWKALDLHPAVLQVVHRQEGDEEFANALNAVRYCNKANDPFSETLDWFNLNTAKQPFTNDDSIILCGKNATASEENEKRLRNIDADLYTSEAKIKGDADISSVNCEKILNFKKGAKVMMLTNGNGYFNGSTGIIDYVHEDEYDDEESYVCIRVNGERCYVYKNTYKVFKPVVDEKKKTVVGKDGQSKEIIEKTVKNEEAGEVIQYPFKLGYAVTIHKSQGMTLTSGVNLKPEIWDSGQLYVALSRVDKRDNIYIDGILKPNNWKLDRKVIDFYKQIDSKWAN